MKGCRPLLEREVGEALRAFAGRYAVRDRCLFVLGVTSGFRVSELLSLRLRDVVRGGLVVRDVTVPRRCMKGRREGRTVYLCREAREAVLAQVRALHAEGHRLPETFLFRSRVGGNRAVGRRTAWRVLRSCFARCNISGPVATHSMRKTFASRTYDHMLALVARGVPVDPFFQTSKALGHVDPKSTTAYLAFRDEHVREAIRRMGGMLHGVAHAHA